MADPTLVTVPVADTVAPPTKPAPESSERPAWLPEKFKNPEDLSKAYGELEKKLGSTPPAAPTPPADTAVIPKPAETPKPPASLDMTPYETEFIEAGELSEKSYKDLEAKGYSKKLVDNYVAGVKAQAAAESAKIFAAVGGAEQFTTMATWAATALPAEEVTTLNAMLAQGGTQGIVAARSLAAAYAAAGGSEPQLLNATGAGSSGQAYATHDDFMKDRKNPEYRTSETFREQVKAKLARSNI